MNNSNLSFLVNEEDKSISLNSFFSITNDWGIGNNLGVQQNMMAGNDYTAILIFFIFSKRYNFNWK